MVPAELRTFEKIRGICSAELRTFEETREICSGELRIFEKTRGILKARVAHLQEKKTTSPSPACPAEAQV